MEKSFIRRYLFSLLTEELVHQVLLDQTPAITQYMLHYQLTGVSFKIVLGIKSVKNKLNINKVV